MVIENIDGTTATLRNQFTGGRENSTEAGSEGETDEKEEGNDRTKTVAAGEGKGVRVIRKA